MREKNVEKNSRGAQASVCLKECWTVSERTRVVVSLSWVSGVSERERASLIGSHTQAIVSLDSRPNGFLSFERLFNSFPWNHSLSRLQKLQKNNTMNVPSLNYLTLVYQSNPLPSQQHIYSYLLMLPLTTVMAGLFILPATDCISMKSWCLTCGFFL